MSYSYGNHRKHEPIDSVYDAGSLNGSSNSGARGSLEAMSLKLLKSEIEVSEIKSPLKE